MKIIFLFLVFSLSACHLVTGFPKAEINTSYEILGAKVKTPNEPNWYLMAHTRNGIYIVKNIDLKTNVVLSGVLTFSIKDLDDDKSFFEYIISERIRDYDTSRFVVLDVNYEFVIFNENNCISYSSLAEDHQGLNNKKIQYYSKSGLICRHPANKDKAIQIETTYRADDKFIPQHINTTFIEFSNGVEFIDIKVD